MAVEDEIRQASDQFYAALDREINGDSGPMVELWSHGSDVATMHPIGGRELGWEEVRAGWEQAAQAVSEGQISLDDLAVVPIADDVAYTLGHRTWADEGWRRAGTYRLACDEHLPA